MPVGRWETAGSAGPRALPEPQPAAPGRREPVQQEQEELEREEREGAARGSAVVSRGSAVPAVGRWQGPR